MAQRYTQPIALERMSQGLCPECGLPPEKHSSDNRFWLPSNCGIGGLTREGVEERIAQYRADVRQAALDLVNQLAEPECECSEEYGPCEKHCEVKFSREGASLRTADESAMQYLEDAESLVPDEISPYGREVINRVQANFTANDSRWITDDPDLAEELYGLVDQVENNIATAGFSTWREDGYRIVKITGGPLADEDEENS